MFSLNCMTSATNMATCRAGTLPVRKKGTLLKTCLSRREGRFKQKLKTAFFVSKMTVSDLEQKLVLSCACTYLYRRVCLKWSVLCMPLGVSFSENVPRWSLCTLYLPACQVTANLGKSGLCSCVPCNTCNVYRALLMPVVDWTAAFVSRNVMQGNSDTKDTNDSQP